MLPAPLALLLRLIVLLAGVDFNQATSPATGGALPGVPPEGVQFAPVLKSELVVPFQSVSPSTTVLGVGEGVALGAGAGVGVGFGFPPLPQLVCALAVAAKAKSRKASASDV